ncbi:DUF6069 family protein [Micromonospora aurantiaca]|uniref:Uncharacterized protein n=1 Tax=Micromonospora aurantiaca (nom. illeg.) TaxID=47850 RepID=A0A1C6SCX4_9ACTN|nr:DUF6069 family protein [Micromonospora aurantiaca]AXH92448.1 hypothetical protein DVH21_22375 [Micromonospora aurantiaca]MBC9005867.1 hypothetical protein [Micromonospora aurantiaca]SCL27331.1 hypothetical protein GA0070615_1043 [Micromonospora aurantiaca]
MPARTLALPGGARVAVVAAQWHHAYGVVTRGRVQLELRDGTPGPVLGRDAGFWLRGTGVRALRNPGRRTATVRILTPDSWRNDMISSTDTGVVSRRTHGFRRLAVTGLVATIAAMVVTTLAAALARAGGVDFEIPDGGGETIPLGGFAVVTGFFSLVGVVIAAALLRFSAHPARRFMWTAVSLTALSMVPPLIAGGDAATTIALVGLHLVAAAVMIPALTRSLRARTG